MDTLTAIHEIRQAKGSAAAYAKVQDDLLSEETYELLLLGAEIAGFELNLPLEALDLLERAIALEPESGEAHLLHFKIGTKAPTDPFLSGFLRNNPTAAKQLDAFLERDLKYLPVNQTELYHEEMATYLIWRGHYQRGLEIIYPDLFTSDGSFAFWKFHLNLLYVKGLLGLRRLDAAEKQLDSIRNGLIQVHKNGRMSETEIQTWKNIEEQLRQELAAICNDSIPREGHKEPLHEK